MKNYGVRFGSGDPRSFSGYNATFLFFVNMATGATVTPPAIAELFAGTGIYNFQWGTTTPIAFLVDAATTSPGSTGRYVSGQLDPNDRGDEYAATMIAMGNTSIALGITGIALGTTAVALGITSIAFGTSIIAQGVSNAAQNVTILSQGTSISVAVAGVGTPSSSFGTSAADPTDLFGYMRRIQELLEGNNTYNKVSGAFTLLSRGSSVTLASKTVTNSVSLVTKS
jgi:hypothetical protein